MHNGIKKGALWIVIQRTLCQLYRTRNHNTTLNLAISLFFRLQARLQEKGCLGRRLKQEVDFLGVVSAHESVAWARDLIKELLNVIQTWEVNIESALETAGINVKISDECKLL